MGGRAVWITLWVKYTEGEILCIVSYSTCLVVLTELSFDILEISAKHNRKTDFQKGDSLTQGHKEVLQHTLGSKQYKNVPPTHHPMTGILLKNMRVKPLTKHSPTLVGGPKSTPPVGSSFSRTLHSWWLSVCSSDLVYYAICHVFREIRLHTQREKYGEANSCHMCNGMAKVDFSHITDHCRLRLHYGFLLCKLKHPPHSSCTCLAILRFPKSMFCSLIPR